jgi:sulfide:quinone oxidoreductase
MKILTKEFAIAPQVIESDIIEAQKSGVVALIDARPDGEDEGQPTAAQTATMARKYGLAFTHVPVTAGTITDADIEKFATALHEAKGPVLGYCRTGTRAAMLWSLAQARRMPTAAIFDAAAAAGVDISAVKPKILKLAQQN